MSSATPHCLIVGAGMAGLVAARRLAKAHWQVTVLEKSKGFGGRMATRRIGEARFDHGTQAFTLHGMFFRALIEKMQDQGLIESWCRGFLNADQQLSLDGYLRFFAAEGMNSIGKYLARDLDVRCNETVSDIALLNDALPRWQVSCNSGLQLQADALIMTPPLPQSLKLIEKLPGIDTQSSQWEQLKAVKYDPCLAVMAVLDGPSGLPEPGGLANADPMSPLKWLADNRQKGISPVEAVTVHGTAHFSRQHWKTDRDEAGKKLWEAAKAQYIQANALALQTHGWRYAEVQDPLDVNFISLPTPVPLILAGDAFGDRFHQLEGAAMSGLDAAKSLLKQSAPAS